MCAIVRVSVLVNVCLCERTVVRGSRMAVNLAGACRALVLIHSTQQECALSYRSARGSSDGESSSCGFILFIRRGAGVCCMCIPVCVSLFVNVHILYMCVFVCCVSTCACA